MIVAPHNRNDLFTTVECKQILQNVLGPNKSGKLLHFAIVPELGTTGFLGEYFHLLLRYELENEANAHETRLFVKTIPYQSAGLCNVELANILTKETTLYETLLSELRQYSDTTWCAQYYYTRQDILVMQNLVDLEFEPVIEPTRFLVDRELKAVLKALATMHASSIAYEVKHNVSIGEELKKVLYEVTVSPTVDFYTVALRAVLAVALEHPANESQTIQEFIKTQLPQRLSTVYDMVNPSIKYRNVFCHRDIWGGNLFFRKTASTELSCALVDFQLCRYSPAAIDVLMTIYLNSKPKARSRLMQKLCPYYYEHFGEQLKSMGIEAGNHMTFNEFKSAMLDFELFGALYNCVSATLLRVPGDYLKEMKQTRPADFLHYANVDRTAEILKLVRSHREFREYMFDCIEEMMKIALR